MPRASCGLWIVAQAFRAPSANKSFDGFGAATGAGPGAPVSAWRLSSGSLKCTGPLSTCPTGQAAVRSLPSAFPAWSGPLSSANGNSKLRTDARFEVFAQSALDDCLDGFDHIGHDL